MLSLYVSGVNGVTDGDGGWLLSFAACVAGFSCWLIAVICCSTFSEGTCGGSAVFTPVPACLVSFS